MLTNKQFCDRVYGLSVYHKTEGKLCGIELYDENHILINTDRRPSWHPLQQRSDLMDQFGKEINEHTVT